MKNAIMFSTIEHSWIRWIKKRIKNNLNFLAMFTGETGSSKSWSALSVAHKLDPDFSVRQVTFGFAELMKLINEFNDPKSELSKRKFKVLVPEEVQVSFSKKDWQSRTNKLWNFIISTFRNQNIILLMSSPFMEYLDSASMKLLHANFECRGWSAKTRLANVRPKILQYNSKQKKFYEHSLYVLRDGKYNKLTHWKIPAPPKHLIIAYEKKKTEFTNRLNKKVYEELLRIENKEENGRKPLTERQKEVLELVARGGIINATQGLDISETAVYKHLSLAKNKGYTVEEFKDIAPDPPNKPKMPMKSNI